VPRAKTDQEAAQKAFTMASGPLKRRPPRYTARIGRSTKSGISALAPSQSGVPIKVTFRRETCCDRRCCSRGVIKHLAREPLEQPPSEIGHRAHWSEGFQPEDRHIFMDDRSPPLHLSVLKQPCPDQLDIMKMHHIGAQPGEQSSLRATRNSGAPNTPFDQTNWNDLTFRAPHQFQTTLYQRHVQSRTWLTKRTACEISVHQMDVHRGDMDCLYSAPRCLVHEPPP
jgi:hypothetical protein